MTETITLKITDYEMYDEEDQQEARLEIISGDFVEGEYVTVRILGKEYTRKVKHSARKYADLYITINGYDFTYTEFYNPEAYCDIDYSRFVA